jgi:hypothetical protein
MQFRFVRCAITADTTYDPGHRLRPVLFLLHWPCESAESTGPATIPGRCLAVGG